jgi:hypothetical protein
MNPKGSGFVAYHSDLGILHVVLKRCRVPFGLLEDALHYRVLQDAHDLDR